MTKKEILSELEEELESARADAFLQKQGDDERLWCPVPGAYYSPDIESDNVAKANILSLRMTFGDSSSSICYRRKPNTCIEGMFVDTKSISKEDAEELLDMIRSMNEYCVLSDMVFDAIETEEERAVFESMGISRAKSMRYLEKYKELNPDSDRVCYIDENDLMEIAKSILWENGWTVLDIVKEDGEQFIRCTYVEEWKDQKYSWEFEVPYGCLPGEMINDIIEEFSIAGFMEEMLAKNPEGNFDYNHAVIVGNRIQRKLYDLVTLLE